MTLVDVQRVAANMRVMAQQIKTNPASVTLPMVAPLLDTLAQCVLWIATNQDTQNQWALREVNALKAKVDHLEQQMRTLLPGV